MLKAHATGTQDVEQRPFQLTFQRLSAYADVDFLRALDFPTLVGKLIDEVKDLFHARAGGVMLYSPETDELVLQKPAFGVRDELVDRYRVPLNGGGNAVRVFVTGQPYLSNQPEGDPYIIQSYVRIYAVRSVMTVPLQLERRRIGVLHVINCEKGEFTERDLRLLQLFACQIAAVLQNARLVAQLHRERSMLERLIAVHDRLVQAAVDGQSLAGITRTLGTLTKGPVLLTDRNHRVLARVPGPAGHVPSDMEKGFEAHGGLPPDLLQDPEFMGGVRQALEEVRPLALPRGGWFVAPIVAKQEWLGCIWSLLAPGEPIDAHLMALEHAATIFALELLRQQARWETEARIKGHFLDCLLTGEYISDESIQQRAAAYGCHLGNPHFTVLVVPDHENTLPRSIVAHLQQVLTRLCPGALVGSIRSGQVAVLVPLTGAATDRRELCEGILAALTPYLHRRSVSLVFTEPCLELASYRVALRRALRTIECRYAWPGPRRVVSYADLGPLGLVDVADRHALELYCHTHLGALAEYDARHKTAFVETLAAYLKHGGQLQATAESLFIHINSLRYRLRRLCEIGRIDLTDSEERFRLQFALKVLPSVRLQA